MHLDRSSRPQVFHRTAALNNVTKIREKHPGQHFVKHFKRANLWAAVLFLCLTNISCYMAHTNNNNGCLKFPEVPTGMKVLVKKLVYVYSQTVLSQTQARFTRDMNRFISPGYSGDLVNLEQMHFPRYSNWIPTIQQTENLSLPGQRQYLSVDLC